MALLLARRARPAARRNRANPTPARPRPPTCCRAVLPAVSARLEPVANHGVIVTGGCRRVVGAWQLLDGCCWSCLPACRRVGAGGGAPPAAALHPPCPPTPAHPRPSLPAPARPPVGESAGNASEVTFREALDRTVEGGKHGGPVFTADGDVVDSVDLTEQERGVETAAAAAAVAKPAEPPPPQQQQQAEGKQQQKPAGQQKPAEEKEQQQQQQQQSPAGTTGSALAQQHRLTK